MNQQNDHQEWLIWSFEHDGWWMPNNCGYTENIYDAGRYTYEEALEIVSQANRYCSIKPNEAMLPVLFNMVPGLIRDPMAKCKLRGENVKNRKIHSCSEIEPVMEDGQEKEV